MDTVFIHENYFLPV
jgi:beta-mannosidase